jgi:hypothetical protein
MKKLKIILSLIFLCVLQITYSQQTDNAKLSGKSAALILKISGKHSEVDKLEVYSLTSYEGTAKKTDILKATRSTEVLKIKVFDQNDHLIYEGFHDNPLSQNLESFEEDGRVNNNILPDETGYINIRFAVPANLQNITIRCYSVKDEKETLLSTLKYKAG